MMTFKHKNSHQERNTDDPFRAALKKLVNEQSVEPTELGKLLLSSKEGRNKSLSYLINLEDGASKDSLIHPSI